MLGSFLSWEYIFETADDGIGGRITESAEDRVWLTDNTSLRGNICLWRGRGGVQLLWVSVQRPNCSVIRQTNHLVVMENVESYKASRQFGRIYTTGRNYLKYTITCLLILASAFISSSVHKALYYKPVSMGCRNCEKYISTFMLLLGCRAAPWARALAFLPQAQLFALAEWR